MVLLVVWVIFCCVFERAHDDAPGARIVRDFAERLATCHAGLTLALLQKRSYSFVKLTLFDLRLLLLNLTVRWMLRRRACARGDQAPSGVVFLAASFFKCCPALLTACIERVVFRFNDGRV